MNPSIKFKRGYALIEEEWTIDVVSPDCRVSLLITDPSSSSENPIDGTYELNYMRA